MNPLLSGFLALVVMLPVVVILGWLEHRADEEERRGVRPVDCRQTTWPDEDIEA